MQFLSLVYARRSSDSDDHQVLSLESQLDELRRLAAARGWTIDEEYVESALARNPGRPIFATLMKRLRSGDVKRVLVWRLDRLARNMVDGGAIIYELSEGRLLEIVTPEGAYTNTGDAKFMLALQFGAATKYTNDLSASVKRGNRRVIKMGKVPGNVPLGYLKTHEHEPTPGPGMVVPDPERFDLVKRLWKEVVNGGRTVNEVWKAARDEWGLTMRPTGRRLARPITLDAVYGVLHNPFYTGRIIRSGLTVQGEHSPMVSEDEFARVQRRFHGHTVKFSTHASYLYTGLLHCGRHLTGEHHEKKGQCYVYYRCGRRRTGERALAKAERELVTLTDLAIDGTLNPKAYSVRRLNYEKRIDHLREALAEPLERLEAWRALQSKATKEKLDLAKKFIDGDDAEKRRIVVRTCSDIIVTNREARPVLKHPFIVRERVA